MSPNSSHLTRTFSHLQIHRGRTVDGRALKTLGILEFYRSAHVSVHTHTCVCVSACLPACLSLFLNCLCDFRSGSRVAVFPWHSQTLTRRAEQSFPWSVPRVSNTWAPPRYRDAHSTHPDPLKQTLRREEEAKQCALEKHTRIPMRAELEETPPAVTPSNQHFLQMELFWEVNIKTMEACTFCCLV